MKRREFVAALGAAVAWPVAVWAQQKRVLRVGRLGSTPPSSPNWIAFDRRMRELGYIEGDNLHLDFERSSDTPEGFDAAANTLIARKIDVLVVAGNEFSAKAALRATRELPIVIVAVDYDPTAVGLVTNLARPSGNLTGVFLQQIELAVKRVQIAKDAFPELKAATIFWDAISAGQWRAMEGAALSLGLNLHGVELRQQPYDYDEALSQAPNNYRQVVMIGMSPFFFNDRDRIGEFTARHRITTICGLRQFVSAGATISYGSDLLAMFRRVAEYVDKIAKGAKPADLPIEQPTKFEFLVNLKAAKAAGVIFPTSVLLRADEVIE
jgi:putative ABC transport system substrate-binding protein